jgi:hypothetical protein
MKISYLQTDLGGYVTHTMVDLPSDGGRWDTSTVPLVKLLSKSGTEILAQTSASTGFSTLISSTATAGSKTIPYSSSSTVTVKRFTDLVLGPNEDGQWEWVTVDGVSSTAITVLDDLTYSYSTSTALKSHDLTFLVAGSTCGSSETGYAEWSYTVDGVDRRDYTEFVISTYAPRLNLSASEVLAWFPRAARIIGSDQRIDMLLRRIWEQRVLPDFARLAPPGALVSGESLDTALLAKFKEIAEVEAKNYESADRYAKEYTDTLAALQTILVDLDEDGSVDDTEIPRGLRTPKIMRG